MSINKAHVRRRERILILGSGSESPKGSSVILQMITMMIRTEGVSGKPKRLDTWETDQLLALWLP